MPEWSVYTTASYKENSFLKGLVSLKCTKWQKAKGSWCLSNQDWAVSVCISISANRGKCYWSFCAVKLLLSCPLHPTIGILGLLGRRAVAVPSCQISTFLRRGWRRAVKQAALNGLGMRLTSVMHLDRDYAEKIHIFRLFLCIKCSLKKFHSGESWISELNF